MLEIIIKMAGTILPFVFALFIYDDIIRDVKTIRKIKDAGKPETRNLLKNTLKDIFIDLVLLTGFIISIIAIWI